MLQNKKRIGAGLFALLLAMLNLLNVQAQSTELTEIIIGDGTETSCEVPFGDCNDNWAYSESIYPAEAIGNPCMIYSIAFDCAETWLDEYYYSYPSGYWYMQIYIGTTTQTSYTSTTNWVYPNNLIKVFDRNGGSYIQWFCRQPGWETFELDFPYFYEGGNLVIGILISGTGWSSFATPMTIYNTPSVGASLQVLNHYSLPDGNTEGTIYDIRPNIKLGFLTEAIASIPASIDMGPRPNNCWIEPYNAFLVNEGVPVNITASTCDNNYFTLSSFEFPLACSMFETIPYDLLTSTGEGFQTGNLTFNYGNNKTLEIPLSAIAYNPTTPDVWEVARQIETFPYSETITNEMTVWDNYRLPGKIADGKDAVFKLDFDSDVVLSAFVSGGENGKVALYREGFEGQGGPLTDNYFSGLGTDITDCQCDFEDGNLGNMDWVLEAPNSYEYWAVTTNNPHSGTYCMKSNSGCWSGNSSNSISFTRFVPHDITMSFWARISSETNCDKGYFFIDGVAKIDGISGDGDWIFYSYEVPQGIHTFKWEYTKDEDWCRNDDCFYVDDLFFWDAYPISLNCGLPVPQGSYYLIASSTSDQFTVHIEKAEIPLPVVVTSPIPSNHFNCYDEIFSSLNWQFGDYTKEYQVLFGETNPPTMVLVNWTDELEESCPITGISDNKSYYWRVNERNSSGITEGPVWTFTTFKGINASVDNIIYVTPTGAGTKDGSSWLNAASSIQAAINAAAEISENQPVVWVAKGNYYANGIYQTINNKSCCFLGHGGVKLYGGFNGDEPANYDLSLRDLENNATILDAESHCYVVGAQSGEWDGFVMQHGGEGGVYVYDGISTVQNCKIFYSNGTGVIVGGGGLNCFHNEVCHHANNGIAQDWYYFKVDIRDCIVSFNGGTGILGNMCIRCQICNNGNGFIARSSMGGVMISCLVANNDGYGTNCDYIVNSTIVNNGLGAYDEYGFDVLCNTIIWGNNQQISWHHDQGFISNNAIQGGLNGKSGIYPSINLSSSSDETGVFPEFEHPSSGIGSAYTDGIWTLKANSPCINMGMENLESIPGKYSYFCSNTGFTAAIDYLDADFAGNQRIQQGRIDLGAWESPYETPNYLYPILPDANDIIYVKADGNGNGSSWANATSNLQEAMETSILYEPVATIWVAQGTYTVSDFPFQVKEELRMFGGFEGNEPADYDLNQRDFMSHASVLDGNNTLRVLNQNDALVAEKAAIIDGFTLSNGAADNGAGAYLLSNMTLSNCTLEYNTANDKGGGIYAENATVENCFVTNNNAQQGGGIYANNTAIVQSHVGNNLATVQGGGLYLNNSDLLQSDVVKNEGGGLYVSLEDNNAFSNLTNNIIWGNDNYNLSFISSISQTNTALNHCAIEGLTNTDNGNISLSSNNNDLFGPQFITPTEDVGLTESQGDWHLAASSLCIDAGTHTLAGTTLPDYDMDANPRVFQNGIVDMGVYEALHEAQSVLVDVVYVSIMQGETYDFFGTLLSEPGTYEHAWTDGEGNHLTQLHLRVLGVLYVSEDGAGTMDGSSWANALDGNTVLESGYTKLADALQNAQCDDCFWVAIGTYLPCGDSDASKHFVLNEGVGVYGGFAGDETTLEERDVENNLTIFCGELQGDDDETNNTNGLFVTPDASTLWKQNAILDGLTLTKGYTPTHRGAALLVNESTAVTMNQCQVHNNREGSIYNSGKLEIIDSNLSNNDTQEVGETYMSFWTGYTAYLSAGVLCNTDQGFVSLNNCLFQSNYSNNNGAIFNSGTMEVDASVFEDNYADCYGVIMSPGKMKVHNTTFNNNRSEHYIAVMMIWDSLELVNCNVTNNNSNYYTSTHFPVGGSSNFASKRTSGIEAWGYSYVDNCSFINNDAGTCSGGALSVIGSADIVNCHFIGNTGVRPWRDPETGGNIGSVVLNLQTDGGALYVEGTATATDCVFEDNSGVDGSTIGVKGSLVMERCVIANSSSTASSHWGSIRNNHELTINNSLIVNNQGGLFFQIDGIHTTLNNTTIANTADELFILENLGGSDRKSIIDFNNCIISGYSTWMNNIWDCQYELNMNHTLVSQQVSGTEGNDNDPLFVNPTTYLGYDENVDPLTYDWTLQAGSPCIDAGDVSLLTLDPLATDLAGEPRVKNGQIDMGAYEFGAYATQNVNFVQGWNWWSAQVVADDLLAQLEQGLGANGVKIVAKDGSYRTYSTNLGGWFGTLTGITVGQMYKIQANTPCDISLTGTPVNPSECPIILKPGFTWIGYTPSVSLSVSEAMSGYTPTAGDVIKSKSGSYASYSGNLGRWVGSLTLEPGKGYIYESKATETKTFYYPSGN